MAAVYKRGQYLNKRRAVLDAWANHLTFSSNPASQKAVSVPFHQTSCTNKNMSYLKFLFCETNSKHQTRHATGHQSQVISSAHLRQKIVSWLSLNPPDSIILWYSSRGLRHLHPGETTQCTQFLNFLNAQTLSISC